MGFNVNPTSNSKPVIKGAHPSQDGGAGNLGYFNGGGGKKKKQDDSEGSIFEGKDDPVDFFLSDDESLDNSGPNVLNKIVDSFKKFFNIS